MIMNKDINKNTRTLVISFVVALGVLVPLRFVEVGNMMTASTGGNYQVLGESVARDEEVVLPEIVEECLPEDQVMPMVKALLSEVTSPGIGESEADAKLAQIEILQNRVCR